MPGASSTPGSSQRQAAAASTTVVISIASRSGSQEVMSIPPAPTAAQRRHQSRMFASLSPKIGRGSNRKDPFIGQPQYSIPRARSAGARSYPAKLRSSILGLRPNG